MTSRPRVPELDGLRGLAIAFVLVWHLFVVGIPHAPDSWSGRIAYGFRWTWSGVDLFFVLSGFLIAGILMDVRASPTFFKTFYARRAFRIVPLYALVVAVYGVLAALAPLSLYLQRTGLFTPAWPVWPYVSFLQNFWSARVDEWGPGALSVTWSLAVEEQFYLFLPLAVFLLERRALFVLFSCLVLMAPMLRIFVFDGPHDFFWRYMALPSRLDALGLGVLTAVTSRNERAWGWITRNWKLLYLVFGLALGRIAVHAFKGELGPRHQAMSSWGYSIFALLYCSLLLIVLARKDSLAGRVARTGWLRFLGGISYGVYLLHQNVSAALRAFFLRTDAVAFDYLWLAPLTVVCVIGLAYASWTWFEKALVERGHRFTF
jgi:peptidoglycan/LPS O-acetylase OafA/YrhL